MRHYDAEELKDIVLFGDQWNKISFKEKQSIAMQRGYEYPICCNVYNKGRPPYGFNFVQIRKHNGIYNDNYATDGYSAIDSCGNLTTIRDYDDNTLKLGISKKQYEDRLLMKSKYLNSDGKF